VATAVLGPEALLSSPEAVAAAPTVVVIGTAEAYWDAIPSDPLEYTVELGTALQFRYSNMHNVHLSLTVADWDACSVDDSVELASAEYGGAEDDAMLTNRYTAVMNQTGVAYIVCAIPMHCGFGQKIKVTVTPPKEGPLRRIKGILDSIRSRLATFAEMLQERIAGTGPAVPSEADLAHPFFGFPKCYLSFPGNGADTEWLDSRKHYEMRPVEGAAWFPYEGSSDAVCAVAQPPLAALGPHWSPIGMEVYQPTSAQNAFPAEFVGRLFVSSHGSWNRASWIGFGVDMFDMDRSDPAHYMVTDRQHFVPPLRSIDTGARIRPVDLRNSPIDGSMLMTSDHDDYGEAGGGLYRIAYNPSDVDQAQVVPMPNEGDEIAGDPHFVLERMASIPCARFMTHSRADPTLLYVSTNGLFCWAANGYGRVWAVRLDPVTGLVVAQAPLIEGLQHPNGVEWHPSGALVVVTDSATRNGRGNCILTLPDADAQAEHVLSGGHALTADDTRLEDLLCGFTAQQGQHSWHVVRMMPDDQRFLVNVGADCNWGQDCLDGPTEGGYSYTTTLIAVDPTSKNVSTIARGIRNTLALKWDENANLLFGVFGSDSASGIPGASFADTKNLPDCQLMVLYGADVQ